MRLTCPNCGAQYEVPDGVVPVAGRDVQCSNCGQTWFQHHPDDDAAHTGAQEMEDGILPDVGLTPDPAPEAGSPKRRQLDPSIAEVLKAEAEREARVREAERSVGLESQPELGLSDPEDETTRRSRQAQARMARMRGTSEDRETETEALAEDAPSSRRDLLPDIDEINSSLRAASDRRPAVADDHAAPGTPTDVGTQPRRSGFRRGFMLAILVAAAFWLLYLYSGPIGTKVPALQPVLTAYVVAVDQARGVLDAQIQALLVKLESLSSETAG
ncbi:zinc-ribbon domain-containing protein [Thalassovita sp.]|uniref:zinc-ribbon domain-containing protein n=1 Tax=Thalassovita sp. TaxID=1979401 RepID=UPI002B2760A7|nr:zinc-ribbon domain-containing protein [Thalassovita sp.]